MAIENDSGQDVSARSLMAQTVKEMRESGTPADADDDSTVAEIGFMAKESTVPEKSESTVADVRDQDPAGSQDAKSEDKQSQETPKGDTEEIYITDDKGRRKVTIDYANREKTKRAYQMLGGLSKLQKEMAQERELRTATETKAGDLQKRFDSLEAAWKANGIDGVIKLITDGRSSLEQEAQAWKARQEAREAASPAELAAMDKESELTKTRSELEAIRKEMAEFKSKVEGDVKLTEQQKAEATVHPVFDKYRFEGKFGDEADEQMFDDMLWNKTMTRLDEIKAGNIAITPEIVDREFKNVHSAIMRRIKATADKKVASSLENKKVAAKESAQRRVSESFKAPARDAEEANRLLETGNLRSFFSNFGKNSKALR